MLHENAQQKCDAIKLPFGKNQPKCEGLKYLVESKEIQSNDFSAVKSHGNFVYLILENDSVSACSKFNCCNCLKECSYM